MKINVNISDVSDEGLETLRLESNIMKMVYETLRPLDRWKRRQALDELLDLWKKAKTESILKTILKERGGKWYGTDLGHKT